jgi:O-methyltransferase
VALTADLPKALIRQLFAGFGLEIHRVSDARARTAVGQSAEPYELVRPSASYAPWLADPDFQAVFERVRQNTLVDKYRLYELWSLVRRTGHLPGDIIEVGVWRGGSGALLAKAALTSRSTSRVYLCDTFAGVVKASSHDSTYRGGEHADTSRGVVEALVRAMGLDNVQILEGVFPEQSAHAVADVSLRLCHIDVDVYESARDVLNWAWKRLVVGGVVVFDDYGFQTCNGITRLVEEEALTPDRLVVHNLNGHAVMVRTR